MKRKLCFLLMLAPLMGAGFDLQWSASTNATYYVLQFQNTATGGISTVTATTNSFVVAGAGSVIVGQTYDWSVSACNATGCSAYSTTRRFKRA